MPRAVRPQYDPTQLDAATEALRAAARRLLDQSVHQEDVEALIQAARNHSGEYIRSRVMGPGTMTEASPVFRGAMSAARTAEQAPFILRPAPEPEEPREYFYCGATVDRDGGTFTCNRRVAHKGECSPALDKD